MSYEKIKKSNRAWKFTYDESADTLTNGKDIYKISEKGEYYLLIGGLIYSADKIGAWAWI